MEGCTWAPRSGRAVLQRQCERVHVLLSSAILEPASQRHKEITSQLSFKQKGNILIYSLIPRYFFYLILHGSAWINPSLPEQQPVPNKFPGAL